MPAKNKEDFLQNYLPNFQIGQGEILWSPVPHEIGEDLEAIKAFYDYALKRAKLLPYFSLGNDKLTILVRPTEFEKAILYLVINESADNELVELTHLPTKTKVVINLNAGKRICFSLIKRRGKY